MTERTVTNVVADSTDNQTSGTLTVTYDDGTQVQRTWTCSSGVVALEAVTVAELEGYETPTLTYSRYEKYYPSSGTIVTINAVRIYYTYSEGEYSNEVLLYDGPFVLIGSGGGSN